MQRIALLESEKHGGKAGASSAASIALHGVVLAFAIAVTSHAGKRGERDYPLHVPLPRFQPEVRMVTQPAVRHAAIVTPKVPAVVIAMPSVIPNTISAPAVAPSLPTAIGSPGVAVPGSPIGTDTATNLARGDNPFDVDEVDVAAAVLSGQRGPTYPDGLRMIGVDGRVLARFIIGKNGRVERDLTIISATADEFATSVKRYLASARYRPATKNGEPVRQLAEQEFDFAVRR